MCHKVFADRQSTTTTRKTRPLRNMQKRRPCQRPIASICVLSQGPPALSEFLIIVRTQIGPRDCGINLVVCIYDRTLSCINRCSRRVFGSLRAWRQFNLFELLYQELQVPLHSFFSRGSLGPLLCYLPWVLERPQEIPNASHREHNGPKHNCPPDAIPSWSHSPLPFPTRQLVRDRNALVYHTRRKMLPSPGPSAWLAEHNRSTGTDLEMAAGILRAS